MTSRPRYNFAGITMVGKHTYTRCDGLKVTTSLQGGSRVTGSSKAPVVLSNGIYPTNYWAVWVTKHDPALARWKTLEGNCHVVIGYTPPYNNPITKAVPYWGKGELPVPSQFFPLKTMFTGRQAIVNTVPVKLAYFDTLRREMTNAHLNKIKEQKAMALVSLAESKKTVQLAKSLFEDIVDTLTFVARGVYRPGTLIDGYRNYARANGLRGPSKKLGADLTRQEKRFILRMQRYYKKHPRQHFDLINGIPKTAADRWLQYRYGIGPMLGDLNATHEYLYTSWADFLHKNDIVVKYREKRETYVSTYTNSDNFGIITGRSTIKAQFISRFYIGNQAAHVARKTGFSPAELASAAWELIPWSFVFDWFLDVGGYINAASATAGLVHRFTTFSTKEEVKGEIAIVGTLQNAYGLGGESDKDSSEWGGFYREVLIAFPFPEPPSITMPFTSLFSKRGFDTLALLFGSRNFSQLTNR